MPNYLFLDNWVLSDYTKEDRQHLLSELIRKNGYTILINGISAAELYNPGWQHAEDSDRTIRAAKFLCQHPCAVVRPERVFKSEIESFPAKLEHLPAEISLDDLPSQHRVSAILGILRGDNFFLDHNIDIKRWVADYDKVKAAWLEDVERIIENACNTGVLTRNKNSQFVDLEKSKEVFLVTLDRRHFAYFSPEEMQGLGTKTIDLFMGTTQTLPAIRFSSLCFWYAYVYTDKAYPMKRKRSDIGDFFQMSLIPYCSAFTVDTTMYRLARRVMAEAYYGCRIYDREELDAVLSQKGIIGSVP